MTSAPPASRTQGRPRASGCRRGSSESPPAADTEHGVELAGEGNPDRGGPGRGRPEWCSPNFSRSRVASRRAPSSPASAPS